MSSSVLDAGAITQSVPVTYNGHTAQLTTTIRAAKGNDWVLMLHGWGCTRDTFTEAFTRTELSGLNLCAVDLLGFGNSDRPKDFSYRLEDQAALLLQVSKYLRARRVGIVGHSMGGGVALFAAPLFGRQLRTIISVEGNIGLPNGSFSPVFARLPYQVAAWVILPMLQLLTCCAPSAKTRRVGHWLLHASHVGMYRSAASLTANTHDDKLLKQFVGLPSKTYICGERSGRVQSVVPYLEEQGMKPRIIANANHLVMLDNPDAFYAQLAELL